MRITFFAALATVALVSTETNAVSLMSTTPALAHDDILAQTSSEYDAMAAKKGMMAAQTGSYSDGQCDGDSDSEGEGEQGFGRRRSQGRQGRQGGQGRQRRNNVRG